MKTKKMFLVTGLIATLLFITTCKIQNTESDQPVFVKMGLTINQDGRQNSRLEAVSGNGSCALISAVPASLSTVKSDTSLSNAYDQQLLDLDTNTVELTVPLETDMRIVKTTWAEDMTLSQAIATETTPETIGISDSFSVSRTTTDMSITVSMQQIVQVESITPADSSTDVSTDTSIGVTFNVAMDSTTVTTNTGSDTTCSGSIQLSKDSFETCIAMSDANSNQAQYSVTASSDSKTFTVTPASNLDNSETYKVRVTTAAQTSGGDSLESNYTQSTGFTTAEVSTSVVFSNVRDNGTVNTNLILGTATSTDTIAQVQISIDGGGYSTATGTSSWSFSLPTGSSTWAQGSEHTLSVRALSESGNYSDVTEITVRKGVNRDVNGDGYFDLIVGAYFYTAGSYNGAAYIFLGSTDGIPNSTPDTTLIGHSMAYFGNSVTLGDVNGDGYADAIVGEYYCGGGTGETHVFFGGSSGISNMDLSGSSCSGTTCQSITGSGTNYFGSSVATGDVNGDGYADIIIGARNGDGYAYVFNGRSSWTAVTSENDYTNRIAGAGGAFGTVVQTGDLNGDGYSDVIIGAPDLNTYTGRIYLYYGGSSGLSSTASFAVSSSETDLSIDGEEQNSALGLAVAAGDTNGDGYDDLVIGAWGYPDGYYYGRVYVYHGGSANLSVTSATDADAIITSDSNNDQMGHAVACGDVNGDGYSDLIVGAEGYQFAGYTGQTFIYHGSSGGITATNQTSADSTLTGESTSNRFGAAVSSTDINGDGYADVIIGAYGYNSNSGRVYYIKGMAGGLSTTDPTSANQTLNAENSGDKFGFSVY